MTLQTEIGKSTFRQMWITKNGLSEERPEPENRISEHDAGLMADVILDLLGMGAKHESGI